MAAMRATRSGFLLVLFAATCFGTLGVFSKQFYDDGGSPWTLLVLRFAVTGPVIAVLALALREPWPGRRLALVGASFGVLQFGCGYCLLEGFERAPVALVTLLYFAYPLVTAVAAALLWREPLGPRRVAILALALAGVALTVGIPDSANAVGIVLGLVAGLCVAGLILASRQIMVAHEVSPIVLCALMFTSPAIALLLASPLRSPDLAVPGSAWGWAAGAVLVGATIPIACFYTGVKRVGASTAGLLSTAEPLVSVVLAYAVLGESLTGPQLLGGALIVVSVAALSLQSRAPAPPAPPAPPAVVAA
jgi:drug/metabolite transporter (DMT)-like permease